MAGVTKIENAAERAPSAGLKVDWSINTNTILQAIGMVVVLGVFILGVRADVARMGEKVGDLTTAVNQLRSTVSAFDRMQAEATQVERRVTLIEARNDAQDQRLGRLGESVIELRATVEPLIRASQQNLPGAPGIRR